MKPSERKETQHSAAIGKGVRRGTIHRARQSCLAPARPFEPFM
jgi:hypothetical protein